MFKLNSRESTASSFRVLRSHSQSKSSQLSVQQFVNLKHKLDFGTQRRHNQSNSERQQNTCVTAAREENRRSPADQKIAISLPQPSTNEQSQNTRFEYFKTPSKSSVLSAAKVGKSIGSV